MQIPFNQPCLTGNEIGYIQQSLSSSKLSGDGAFTQKCQQLFEQRYGVGQALLTPSCTAALEMAAMLADIGPGDEILAPAYTFVSSVNAFVLRGANIVFADSRPDHPNLDVARLEALISPRTRAIVAVHYAGVACDLDALRELARACGLILIEDAAQGIEARYRDQPLGSLGDFGTLSFHETKNLHCGEGGLLTVQRPQARARAEILREKGTNRKAFFRGEIDKYGWVDIGSSYLLADFTAAFLYAQLEQAGAITARRLALWQRYQAGLAPLTELGVQLPEIPAYARHNGHIFYLVCRGQDQRSALIAHLKAHGVQAVFHYQALHRSAYYQDRHDGRPLPQAERYTDCLLRLPLYDALAPADVDRVIGLILDWPGWKAV